MKTKKKLRSECNRSIAASRQARITTLTRCAGIVAGLLIGAYHGHADGFE